MLIAAGHLPEQELVISRSQWIRCLLPHGNSMSIASAYQDYVDLIAGVATTDVA